MSTLVGSLSRVNTSMTSETRRVGEPFPTADMLALVRLLASMGSDVNSQGTSLDEALPTTGCHARVWTLVGVDSVMSLEIRFPVEAFATSLPIALERSGIRLVLYQLHDVHSDVLQGIS